MAEPFSPFGVYGRVPAPRAAPRAPRPGTEVQKARVRVAGKSYRRALRTRVLRGYGARCACALCDCAVEGFLTIRPKIGKASEIASYMENGQKMLHALEVAGFPPTHEVRCFNCLVSMSRDPNGTCAHLLLFARQ